MRKGISITLALLLLAGSFFLAKYLIENSNKPKPKFDKIVKTVFTETVENKTIPILITANGNLIAKNRIEIYSEVQGVLMPTAKEFKPGTSYKKGETIVKINSDEFYANLQAQKSSLLNNLTAIIPDIRMDYPDQYEKWNLYIDNFSINNPIQPLPITISDKEKYFISGRGILTSYFNVKTLEVKLDKYNLRAPFNGLLTEALVTPGALVRPGQKLGELIDPSVFEVGVSVKSEYHNLLEVGKSVELQNLEKTKTWIGKVVRINGKVNTHTQTIEAFIEVHGEGLKEGQYLEVVLEAKSEENAFEVSRKLLIENSKLYVVKDSVLDLVDVDISFENKNTVVIKNLPNGTQLLSKVIPGAHAGMLVKVYNENKEN
jgi:multidrug efflux pump subunit AcrA (membrane-fusion protein)